MGSMAGYEVNFFFPEIFVPVNNNFPGPGIGRNHRVSKGFVIQGGDPSGNGTGGKSIYGKDFEDELNPSTPSYQAGYVKGTLAMANRGPNTNTSQFFIMLRDIPGMPKNYTIFGKVVKGLDVVDSIGAVDIVPQMGPNDGKPKVDVVMKKVVVAK